MVFALDPCGAAIDQTELIERFSRIGTTCFAEIDGSFSAILRDHKRRLVLARDRCGQSCLYYAVRNGTVYISDSLARLLDSGKVEPKISPTSLLLYFSLGFIPAPHSIYEGVNKLPAGTSAIIESDSVTVRSYAPTELTENSDKITEVSIDRLGSILNRIAGTIVERVESYTVLLSGGVDSSLVVHSLKETERRGVRTASIILDQAADEGWAEQAASHLGTKHQSIRVGWPTTDNLEQLVSALDEPVASSMFILLVHLLSKIAHYTKVAVTGIGADDLFGGLYEHVALGLWSRKAGVPPTLPEKDSAILSRMIESMNSHPDPVVGWIQLISRTSDDEKLALARDYLGDRTPYHYSREYFDEWINQWPSFLEGAMSFARKVRLPDQTMRVVEAAGRITGVSHYSPFLANKTAGFADSLSHKMLGTGMERKALIRALARQRLPTYLLDRPKFGFSFPVAQFLDRFLSDPGGYHLLESSPAGEGKVLRRWMNEFRNANGAHRHHLASKIWNVLVWQLWCQTHECRM